MSLFGKRPEPSPDLQEALEKADRALARAKALELAFEELQDKVYRWMQRSRKREALDSGGNGSPEPAGGIPTFTHPAAARVWARRGLRGVPTSLPGEG